MSNLKVMIVDDDKDILEVTALMLNAHGYTAICCSNGEDLISKIYEHEPALVMLDVQLGHFDGRFLCKEIKAIEKLGHVKVILFSANHKATTDYTAYGCDDFLEKPFEMKNLVQKVNFYLKSPDTPIP